MTRTGLRADADAKLCFLLAGKGFAMSYWSERLLERDWPSGSLGKVWTKRMVKDAQARFSGR